MPDLPAGIVVLWSVFLELHAARGAGAMGMAPLSYHDIDAYQRVTQSPLTGWEVQTLLAVDRAVLAVCSAEPQKKE